MFTGLSAFPLTPFAADKPDEVAFLRLLQRLTEAKVDSLGVLGSTGSYACLTRAQRRRITELAVSHSEAIPVMVSIGAVSTTEVLQLAEDALQAGTAAISGLTAPDCLPRPLLLLSAPDTQQVADVLTC